MDDRLDSPLGLMLIASYLRKLNPHIEIAINDLSGIPERDWEIKEANIYGITVYAPSFFVSKQIISECRKINPGAKIVVGGAHPTALPGQFDDLADYVVIGEGEEALCKIVSGYDKKIVKEKTLFDAFPAYDLVDLDTYHRTIAGKPSIPYITTRGCPYICAYCGLHYIHNLSGMRSLPLNTVIEDLHVLKETGIEAINFQDDIFTLKKERLFEILSTIKKLGLVFRCYSDDTEVYTKRGWLLFKDVKNEDLILSVDPETRNLEWSNIRRKIKIPYKGEMLYFSNKKHSFDLLVTPDHPFFVYERIKKDGKRILRPFFKDSYLFLNTDSSFYLSSEWEGKSNITVVNLNIPIELFAEFMGYYLSEGCVTRCNGKDRISISQFNPTNLDKMYSCCKKLDIKSRKYKSGIVIQGNDNLIEYLRKFGKSYQKYIPDEIKESSKEIIEIFLDAYILGDGSVRYRRGHVEKRISTSSMQMASDLGELIIKSGKSVSYEKSIPKEKIGHIIYKNGSKANIHRNYDNFRISINTSRYRFFSKMKIKRIFYDGYVYDLEIEKNHTLLIRRNGRVSWQRNCMGRAGLDTEEVYERLADSGCAQISWGIESGSQYLLDRMNKKVLVQDNLDVIRWAKKYGINSRAFFIFGFPGETRETIQQTKDFIDKADPDQFFVSNFCPYPGTPIWRDPKKFGITKISSDFSQFYQVGKDGTGGVTIETEWIKMDEFRELELEFREWIRRREMRGMLQDYEEKLYSNKNKEKK